MAVLAGRRVGGAREGGGFEGSHLVAARGRAERCRSDFFSNRSRRVRQAPAVYRWCFLSVGTPLLHWRSLGRRGSRALVGAALLSAGPVWAGETPVLVGCDELSREQAAEVEARARASLLTSDVAARQVRIACEPNRAYVEVESSSGNVTRELSAASPRLQDDLVDAVDSALHELSERRAQPPRSANQPEAAPRGADALGPTPAPTSGLPRPLPALVALPPPARATPIARARAVTELLAEATAESWSGVLGLGGNVGFAHGSRRLRYGLAVGGAAATGVKAAFGVSEWRAQLELGWEPSWAAGFRGALGAGPSLLVVSPAADTAPRASTVASAWFAEFSLTRPFWFHEVGVVPGVALRLFSAKRDVNVDGRERFTLWGMVPQLGLGLLYVVD